MLHLEELLKGGSTKICVNKPVSIQPPSAQIFWLLVLLCAFSLWNTAHQPKEGKGVGTGVRPSQRDMWWTGWDWGLASYPGVRLLWTKNTYLRNCIVLPPTHKAPSTSDVVYFSAAKQGNGRFRPQIWMNFRKNSKRPLEASLKTFGIIFHVCMQLNESYDDSNFTL